MEYFVILVVDDDKDIQELIEVMLLHHFGERAYVFFANNGVEGLSMLDFIGGNADLVLTDGEMPEMDGEGFAREAIRIYPHLADKFIFITGSDPRPAYLEIPVIAKPFRLATLCAYVDRSLSV